MRIKVPDVSNRSFSFAFFIRTKGTYNNQPTVIVPKTNRLADFLNRQQILKFPPLYMFRWDQLDFVEQKQALRALQAVNKTRIYEALTVKNGGHHVNKLSKKDEPKDWKVWTLMITWEREQLFNKLKVSLHTRLKHCR